MEPRKDEMNAFVTTQWTLIDETHDLRDGILAVLADADLAATPGGANPPLRDLFVDLGRTERVYTESFRTGRFAIDAIPLDARAAASLDELRAWFAGLDEDLKIAFAALSDDDLATFRIEREEGFAAPPVQQLFIYREAVLIVAAKASVFLRLIGRPLSARMLAWIG